MPRNRKKEERERTANPVVNPFPVYEPDVEVAESLGIERDTEKREGNREQKIKR